MEWPTVLLCAVIYGGWFALTWFWHALPAVAIVALGGWVVAWFMSLQHELLHGHPTRHQWLNDALGFAPLVLWLPYARYKHLHLVHHRDEQLTDPALDPESAYVGAADWATMGPFGRWLHLATVTFVGRLVVAPWRSAWGLWRGDAAKILAGDGALARIWLVHLAGVAVLIGWLRFCGISPLAYALLVAWPATGLAKLRSLAEHREAERVEDRTAIVEHGGALGLLFLYNNLHVVHHERPALPWYWLPAAWAEEKQAILA
ncbi:MAG: fatty acid desaturase, partial [Proteobacteria bacterium]|nr:fatty acid desaturase [Pseudomonadota bacterium]